jgi:hypothetical protein
MGKEYDSPEPLRVCSGLDNTCYDSTKVVDVQVCFVENNIKHTIVLTCRIANKGSVNLIIGRQSIKENNLVSKLPRFFFKENETNITDHCQPCNNTPGDISNRPKHLAPIPCACAITATAAALTNGPHTGIFRTTRVGLDNQSQEHPRRKVHFNDTPLDGANELATQLATSDTQVKSWGIVATVLRQFEQLSDAALINTDEIDSDKKDMFAPYRDPPKSNDVLGVSAPQA